MDTSHKKAEQTRDEAVNAPGTEATRSLFRAPGRPPARPLHKPPAKAVRASVGAPAPKAGDAGVKAAPAICGPFLLSGGGRRNNRGLSHSVTRNVTEKGKEATESLNKMCSSIRQILLERQTHGREWKRSLANFTSSPPMPLSVGPHFRHPRRTPDTAVTPKH